MSKKEDIYSTNKGRKFWYANGFQISQCRRLCQYVFGSFFIDVEPDNINLVFNIILNEKVYDSIDEKWLVLSEECDVEGFRDFWCSKVNLSGWKILIVSKNEV